jgi:hypothetical protein
MGAAGRPKGTKNKDSHKAGGDRGRSTGFKSQKQESEQEKQKKADDYFNTKTASNQKA